MAATAPQRAHAQTESILVTPSIPDGFDKGRNVAVTERPRPDYDALGIPLGQFNVFPSIRAGVGYTSNVLPASTTQDSDAYLLISPDVRVISDWSRHQVSLRAGIDSARYLSTGYRNQDEWHLAAQGRYDFSEGASVTGDAQVERIFETPFSGAIESDLSVLSSYVRSYGALRGDYQMGQFRALVAADFSHFAFSNIEQSGSTIDQSYRDRSISRLTGQLEYALTPSASVFGRIGYDRIGYQGNLPSGLANRDADSLRGSIGINVDLSSFLRGTLSIGYLNRNYDSTTYEDVSGFSAEAKAEYFFSELTNFTIDASRTLQDANVGAVGAFFDNRVSGIVDHELLRNLLLKTTVAYTFQNYVNSDRRNHVFGASVGGRYLATPLYDIGADVSYTKRSTNQDINGRNFDELRALFSVTVHP